MASSIIRRDMDRVEVVWLDAVSDTGAVPLETAIKSLHPIERSNLGYLLYQDDERVLISCARYLDDDVTKVDERIVIPVCMVKSIKYLDVKENG